MMSIWTIREIDGLKWPDPEVYKLSSRSGVGSWLEVDIQLSYRKLM